ncbi:MAG: polyphenol oxidase family protein [Armatimonadia bacterium]
MSDLWLLRHTGWPGAVAGVTQRGPHDPADPASGYNLGHTANANHGQVDALRRRALDELGVGDHSLVCSDQIHGTRISVASYDDLPQLPRRHGWPYYPEADALITADDRLALMLFFADCCPVTLYSPDARCGGIAHCGWRGSVADLAGKTVRALSETFGAPAHGLRALVGPCICAKCYEIGPEVADAVLALNLPETLHKQDNSLYLDLLALNTALLERAGVLSYHIQPLTTCTSCGDIPLHSYRRHGPTVGRLAAFFALRSSVPET